MAPQENTSRPQQRKSQNGRRGCRFGCFHLELAVEEDDRGQEKTRARCCKGWPRVPRARFMALPRPEPPLQEQEAAKNKNPNVFLPERDHPFEGMSNPVAQVSMRCNVDVKYLGRAFSSDDLAMLDSTQCCADLSLTCSGTCRMRSSTPANTQPRSSKCLALFCPSFTQACSGWRRRSKLGKRLALQSKALKKRTLHKLANVSPSSGLDRKSLRVHTGKNDLLEKQIVEAGLQFWTSCP